MISQAQPTGQRGNKLGATSVISIGPVARFSSFNAINCSREIPVEATSDPFRLALGVGDPHPDVNFDRSFAAARSAFLNAG